MRSLVLALALALPTALLTAPPAQAAAADPILPKPVQSGIGLEVEEYAQFPKSEPTPPPTDPRLMRHARINALDELPDGSGRLAVPDLNGKLYLVKDGKPQPYLDVGATFAPAFFSGRGLGQGFGYAAFHPDFKQNGIFYTVHTELASKSGKQPDLTPQKPDAEYQGIITEWTAKDPAADTFDGTRRELLRIGFNGQIHGIQQIGFNPTARPGSADHGKLYAAVGDGGIGYKNTDPQNLALPHGKILRIDPRGSDSSNGKYGVPADNPFTQKPGALGEIFAYGMRDPHRFSWDTGGQHRMFLGHIGQHAVESVYEVRAGDNLGWSEREGPFVYDKAPADPCDTYKPLPADDEKYGYTYPVAAYDHDPPPGWDCKSDIGRAISGGFVYRGDKAPELRGKYLFGDLVDGRVFYTESDEMDRDAAPEKMAQIHQLMLYDKASGKRVTAQDLAGDKRVDLRFGKDAAGELFLIAKANGKVWRVTGTREFAGCETGGTTVTDVMGAGNWAPVTPAKWQFPGDEAILAEAGAERPGPRRPYEYAVLTAGPRFGAMTWRGQVRLDTPVDVSNRDVVVIFGYRSDTEFYYAHLSQDNTILPHNGIFKVNNADRERIDHQWTGYHGADPAIDDAEWHDVAVKHCAATGEIGVYVDGAKDPLMTATDTTFGSGRVGFGSFDNVGRLRGLSVTGEPATS
ncbi:PQQ-dependent sugar dehydrogenase [Streptomyces sp. A7024]|uniref:PQQ-dependent sugar dehydrogenase n=1 Tax=Streptomyces coryli TaxID=1128680 RepID=A0A6G4TW27_9ACTN|nr:PQQ-dependent sugar dehydrogenase [Streptomyces coryli]